MRPVRHDNYHWRLGVPPHYYPAGSPHYPHDTGLGPLPLILIAAFGIAATANGIGMMTGLSFLFSLLVAVGLHGFKLYFLLRYQPSYERSIGSRRDKVFGYLTLAFILLILTAFGLNGLGSVRGTDVNIALQTLGSIGSFRGFLNLTLAKNTYAVVCWIVAAVIEIIIIIIALRDRRGSEYWQ
jgi:hypothetical protein